LGTEKRNHCKDVAPHRSGDFSSSRKGHPPLPEPLDLGIDPLLAPSFLVPVERRIFPQLPNSP
jgi:hypothetical protein